MSLGHRTAIEFVTEARLGFSLFGDSGDIKDKAEPSQPCLTRISPHHGAQVAPQRSPILRVGGINIAHLCSERPVP
jgi:hypothetical protein